MISALRHEQMAKVGSRLRLHPELVGVTFPGPHDQADRAEVLRIAMKLPDWPTVVHDHNELVEGIGWVLDWLETFPGDGWHDRWIAAGANTDPDSWILRRHGQDPRIAPSVRAIAVSGIRTLIVARVILPDYPYFSALKTAIGYRQILAQQDPDLRQRLQDGMDPRHMSAKTQHDCWTVLARVMLHTGHDLPAITKNDLFAFRSAQLLQLGVRAAGCHQVWELLTDVGILEANHGLYEELRLGQRSVAHLVDRYDITPGPIRDLFVRYLQERKTSVDYTTLSGLAADIVGNFWADIEKHHPGIDTLALPADVITAWKERLATVVGVNGETRPRASSGYILLNVRSFYLDLRDWAHEDPSIVPYAVPSPVTRADATGLNRRKLHVRAKIHQRIRERVPLLPEIVAHLERELAQARALREAAAKAPLDDLLTVDGRSYVREDGYVKAARGLPPGTSYVVRDLETGERFSTTRREHDAFWLWAIVETLRHTGLRIEELLELTHLALVSHRLSTTGETVPLLQVIPSKTNQERLLLVTPELASVLALVISRLRNQNHGTIPLVARYDHYERTVGPRLPHLFQRDYGSGPTVIGTTSLRQWLKALFVRMELRDRAGEPIHLTPHDFRRIFSTTAVQDGLPLHIASKILGHRHLTSTEPYVAVFQDDLIRTYRTFVDNRRTGRPPQEYREPTDAEWEEFEEHFTLRRVELGSCARPYGSRCEHEHACLRCPVLRVDPAQLDRLAAIITNLEERIVEAEERGWPGEVAQLTVTVKAARDKLARHTPTGPSTAHGLTLLPHPTTRALQDAKGG